MRRPLPLALALVLLLVASAASAAREVVAPRVSVVFEEARLEPFAQRAAAEAEAALRALEARLGSPLPRLTVRLDDRTDRYNAFASVLPRPTVALRALFPAGGELGFGAPDPLYELLVHELTHLWQFGFLERPAGAAEPLPRLGVVGEGVAAVPPAWLAEGLAVWAESELSGAGRLSQPRTRGLLRVLALEGAWPSLAAASRDGLATWPGGEARYLLGGAFVARLVERHGLPTLRAALREFNAGGPLGTFAGAWRRAAGTDLRDEWEGLRAALLAEAEAAAATATRGERLTRSEGRKAGPAPSPGGRSVAWSEAGALRVARVTPAGLADERPVREGVWAEGLDWLDEETLLYARPVRAAGREALELHALDLASGRETRWTRGARARFPRALPGGCALYVEDDAVAGSSLHRACPGGAGAGELVWRAPAGHRIVGLAVSGRGRIALSLWRGGRVDLALLDGEALRWLTTDRAAELEPAWRGERALLYRRDARAADGAPEAWRLETATGLAAPVARPLGGAYAPAPLGDDLLYLEATGAGLELARAPLAGLEPARVPEREPPPPPGAAEEAAAAAYPVRPYRPLASLVPYGWVPAGLELRSLAPLRLALAAELWGEDRSGRFAYVGTVGYDPALAAGHLGGGHLALDLGVDEGGLLAVAGPPRPLAAGVRVGVWPHAPHLAARTETALGATARLRARRPVERSALLGRLAVGLVHLRSTNDLHLEARLDAAWSSQRAADRFGYRLGPRLAVTAVTTAAPFGASRGAWLDADHLWPLASLGDRPPLVAEAGLRAGWRMAPPVPLALSEWAAVGTLGARASLPLGWAYGDGRYALERLTLEPRLRLWYDGALGIGGDAAVWADATALYLAPVSVGVQGGWAEGPWLRVGARLPR